MKGLSNEGYYRIAVMLKALHFRIAKLFKNPKSDNKTNAGTP